MQNSNFTKHLAFSPGTIMVNRKGDLSHTQGNDHACDRAVSVNSPVRCSAVTSLTAASRSSNQEGNIVPGIFTCSVSL